MAERKPNKFAFWSYDLFPFVVGGEGYMDRDYFVAPSFQMKVPKRSIIALLDLDVGREAHLHLRAMETQHRIASKALMAGFQQQALAVLPALAKQPAYKKGGA